MVAHQASGNHLPLRLIMQQKKRDSDVWLRKPFRCLSAVLIGYFEAQFVVENGSTRKKVAACTI